MYEQCSDIDQNDGLLKNISCRLDDPSAFLPLPYSTHLISTTQPSLTRKKKCGSLASVTSLYITTFRMQLSEGIKLSASLPEEWRKGIAEEEGRRGWNDDLLLWSDYKKWP